MPATAPPLIQTANLSKLVLTARPARMVIAQVLANVLRVPAAMAVTTKVPGIFVIPKPKLNTAAPGVQPAVQMLE